MLKRLIAATLMLSFTAVGFCDATVETWDPDSGSGTLGPGGCVGRAYLEAYNTALLSNLYACEWPESYPGSDEPGAAYKEGKAVAEDADCHEDYQNEDQS